MSHTTSTSPMLDSWQQAETCRMENWRRKQQNDIRRQLLAHDTTHFGRKRRARRARGRAVAAEVQLSERALDLRELEAAAGVTP